MDNITHYLNLPEKAKVLDLACGKDVILSTLINWVSMYWG
jgi:hypothetical protein